MSTTVFQTPREIHFPPAPHIPPYCIRGGQSYHISQRPSQGHMTPFEAWNNQEAPSFQAWASMTPQLTQHSQRFAVRQQLPWIQIQLSKSQVWSPTLATESHSSPYDR